MKWKKPTRMLLRMLPMWILRLRRSRVERRWIDREPAARACLAMGIEGRLRNEPNKSFVFILRVHKGGGSREVRDGVLTVELGNALDHPPDLGLGQLREHRQGQHFPGSLFGDRHVSRLQL